MAEHQNVDDPDVRKGAVEGDGRARSEDGRRGNTSLDGQNPHRTESNLVKSNDSDFPEPGGSPEHSGQKVEERDRTRRGPGGTVGQSPEPGQGNQDPGHRQKQNQADKKDDPLAA